MADIDIGQRWLIRRSIMGQLLEVDILALSPSGLRVKLSDIGWQTRRDIGFVEMLSPCAETQEASDAAK